MRRIFTVRSRWQQGANQEHSDQGKETDANETDGGGHSHCEAQGTRVHGGKKSRVVFTDNGE
ncbi:MAG: hypothetical protein OXH19_10390 [Chloroflexi bacterium]|nr:hypothetical protein [Chloroflexota bacterium]MCY3686387.1 hypothetical protein [Chloroflexota bacterium]